MIETNYQIKHSHFVEMAIRKLLAYLCGLETHERIPPDVIAEFLERISTGGDCSNCGGDLRERYMKLKETSGWRSYIG